MVLTNVAYSLDSGKNIYPGVKQGKPYNSVFFWRGDLQLEVGL